MAPLVKEKTVAENHKLRELRFINSDATPKVATIRCDTASVAHIMAWYGSYYAGDRYRVELDGEKIAKDRNGELAGDINPARPTTEEAE